MDYNSILRLIAFGAGTFCLGGALAIALIFALLARNSEDGSEGCLGKFLALAGLGLALFFFYLGVS